MIEEHVIKLVKLQAERTLEENKANGASALIDMSIKIAEDDLKAMREERDGARLPYTNNIDDINSEIDNLHEAIIDDWGGEHKTMKFDAGTLKFRQTGSLKIHDELFLFSELYDHIKLDVLIEKYLTGFNLTAVKKYMGVHDLPIDVVELEYKTTVKLEQKSG